MTGLKIIKWLGSILRGFLKVKIKMIAREEAIATLKRVWRTDHFKFVGQFVIPKKENGKYFNPNKGAFQNFSVNDREIFYPKTAELKYDRKVTFKGNVIPGLEDGKFYDIELELADDEKRMVNPFALKIKNVLIRKEEHIAPKDFIQQWFYKKGHTPGDAATIAGQLTLNELELYTHTKRFIFELIQNADDMPDGSKPVNIEINLLQNHLLFLHNGKFFDREDVTAISDAAKSTKSKGLTQTGYKGIGFKSVFTDSTRVYIKSGDYFFKFDKLEPIYKDFYGLYKGYSDSLTPKAKKEFETEYKGSEKEYTNIDRIPWQIKPIWVEQNNINNELKSSNFITNNQVAIALEIGENILRQKDYNGMILGLLKEPRFLLFLRKTKKFKYISNNKDSQQIVDIAIKEEYNNLGIYSNEELIASYIKHEFEININNEDFAKTGLNFQKREIEGGKIEFFNEEGNKLDNIPEKLGRLDKTIISLSAKVDKNQVERLDKDDSILFNYLPTSDQRFGFPFLVNADFVSKTDREFIQIENKWNHYIFYHLGRICIEWIAKLGETKYVVNDKLVFSYAKSYLNLLPENLLDEENEELASINIAFNKGLKDALSSTSFIIDAKGTLKKCNEIIIDDTCISEIFGKQFFTQVSKSKKELPHIAINKSSLKKKYLNIECYKPDLLEEALQEEKNLVYLKTILQKADDDKYLRFLKWLDSYCKKNDSDSDWILALPFIRIGNEVLSLNEALNVADFIFKTSKTKSIESLLVNIGFKLSEFYCNADDYKHIYTAMLTQDSYLKTDVKLYEHIAAAKQVDKLTATEKNTLLTFFETLDEVGKAKYAKSLSLFKSKKANSALKPLASLLSNTCENLPLWLSDFVIDSDEENALSEVFRKKLLKQGDILEKIFCNLATFNEISAALTTENIEGFYDYILNRYKEKPEERIIDFSQIPWAFIPGSSSFVLPTTIYWPDSMTKLSPDSYTNVKTIIETVSVEILPHYAALQLKAPFALGSKEINIATVFNKTAIFDVLPINYFLDWLQSEGNNTFFTNFSITKTEEQYSMAPSGGGTQYYSDNQDLVSFIEASDLNTQLQLLPKEVYTADRKKLGLLEANDLLKYGLENGLATPAFAKFILQAKDADLSLQYLSVIESVSIDTSKTYDSESDEFKILKLAILSVINDDVKLKSFREKIVIDNHPLFERAISEDIYFHDKKIGLKTKLSEILPKYKDKAFPISELAAQFVDFNDNKNLIALFKSEGRTPKKILKELNELKPEYYNPAQTFFLSFYQSQHPDEEILTDKVLFIKNEETNSELFNQQTQEFLDICLKENNFKDFVDQAIIPGFTPTLYILEEEYAIDSEKVPIWLSNWIGKEIDGDKNTFLQLLGVNSAESPVVLFRKAIKEAQLEPMNINRELIKTDVPLINTLTWLSEQQTKNDLNLKKIVLQPLYNKLENRKIPVIDLLFPSLTELNVDNYTLLKLEDNEIPHLVHEGWGEYKQDIFSSLIAENKITDEVVPKTYRAAWKIIEQKYVREANVTKIINNSYAFEEDYYLEWVLKARYKIAIYKGYQLPYEIKYNGIVIKSISEGYAAHINNEYYLAESKKEFILSYLEGVLPDNILNSLKLAKGNFAETEKKKETEVEYTDEETEALKRLFGDEIPKDFHKDINIAALISALIYLAKKGFDVTEAEENLKTSHEYSQLSPVYSPDKTKKYTVMGRSAKTGLLYLTATAWDRLDADDIMLFVNTGKRELNHYLFQNKHELLKVSNTKFQVFRVEAESNALHTDAILNGTFDKSKIWLIFKMKDIREYNSIFNGDIKRNEENPDYNNVNTSEDSDY
ncbi:sacsin N-terminal ATP-binding-like domain-containing protein [Flavobacterium sp. TSSA_36]|uniref:sacsin N-terminal ATP-binding-like domain-containing protein n=1 Tax=Flavobacterium sp. TSSA_36 TaxID=3447669 RepID=UPI003F3BE0FB